MVICFLMTHLGLLMRKVRIFFSKKQKKAPLRQKKDGRSADQPPK